MHNHPAGTPPSSQDVKTFLSSGKIQNLHTVTSKYDYILIKTNKTTKNIENLFEFISQKLEEEIKEKLNQEIALAQKNVEIFETQNNAKIVKRIKVNIHIKYQLQLITRLSELFDFKFERKAWENS
ncbi:hypothetical protein ThvES_00002160 [Thiovulum sp. ES]|nr:hypothetical protein ThvES_00002160 [Thiovulum sp. ES]